MLGAHLGGVAWAPGMNGSGSSLHPGERDGAKERPGLAGGWGAGEPEVGCQRVATAALSISRATVAGCEISPR